MKIELTARAAQPTLFVRLRTGVDELTEAFDRAYAEIAGYLKEIGEKPTSAPYAAYYNHDMQDLDVEMGFPVARALPGRGSIQAGALPAMERAVCGVHVGPYSRLNDAYGQVYGYIAENGYAVAGAHYDFYVNDPDDTAEDKLITRVVIPVKARGEGNMEGTIFCQSCGMPLNEEAAFGTEKDGGKNGDYCVYCYKDGAFTADMTMDEMIAYCAEHVDEWDMKMTKEAATAMMRAHFPTLKRWRTA